MGSVFEDGLGLSGEPGVFAPGNGFGLGTSPVLAQPEAMAAASTNAMSHPTRVIILCQCIVVTLWLLRVYGVGTLTALAPSVHDWLQVCNRRFF
jgi:hypothetical protein